MLALNADQPHEVAVRHVVYSPSQVQKTTKTAFDQQQITTGIKHVVY